MVLGNIGGTMLTNALSKAAVVAADAAARAATIRLNASKNITAATNQGGTTAPGIPTPVLVGGIAAVGLLAIIIIAKKKKKK